MTLTTEDLARIVAAVKADLAEEPEVNPLAVGGFFQVSAGQTILADHVNTAMINGVPKFANAAARDAQWPAPPDGAMCYLADVNYLQVYSALITGGGSGWRVPFGMRMGYAQMGLGQVIPNTTQTRLLVSNVGGAANKAGRATWTVGQDYVTVPLAGTYLAVGDVRWPSNATGQRILWIQRFVSGVMTFTGVAGGATELNVAGSSDLRMSVSAMIACNAGDRISLVVQQTSDGNLTLPSSGGEVGGLALHFLGAD